MKTIFAALFAFALTATAAATAPLAPLAPPAGAKVTLPVVQVQEKKATPKKKATPATGMIPCHEWCAKYRPNFYPCQQNCAGNPRMVRDVR